MSVATQAIKHAEDGVGSWLMGVVSGHGSSVSQIVVSGVLSVIPGVGQIMDARDLILGVVALAANPANPWAWAEMVVTLVGLIPGFGDAFKVAFKFIRHGHPLGRVLDTVSPTLRGNVERWLRSANWQDLTHQITGQFHRVIDQFISTLDSWAVRSVLGHAKVAHFTDQLKLVRHKSSAMLGAAVDEIKHKTEKLLQQEKPTSTQRKSKPSGKPEAPKAPPAGKTATPSGPKNKKLNEDGTKAAVRKKRNTHPDAHNNKTNTSDKREVGKDQKKKKTSDWRDGTLAEHISDYYALQQHKFKKINHNGRRIEENDVPRGQGIDHIWRGPVPRLVVGETKGTLVDGLAFLALAGAAGDGDPDSPLVLDNENIIKGKTADGKQVTYERTGKDGIRKTLPARGLSETKHKGTQMSHQWIFKNIPGEAYATREDKRDLVALGKAFERKKFKGAAPWDRWVLMVTKPQMVEHHNSGGKRHRIRQPRLIIPDNVLPK